MTYARMNGSMLSSLVSDLKFFLINFTEFFTHFQFDEQITSHVLIKNYLLIIESLLPHKNVVISIRHLYILL